MVPPTGTIITGKNRELVCDPGVTTVCAGSAFDHNGYVCRMWKKETNKCSETRDTIWLSCMLFKEKVKDYKEESNSHSKVWVNLNHMPEERREDSGSDNNLSDSSSVVDDKTRDKGWIWYSMRAGLLNEADIFIRNLYGSVFENFTKILIGKNEYVHSCY